MSRIKIAVLLACTFLPSWGRLAIWRLLGFRIGRGCRVSTLSVVVADRIELGDGAVIEALTMIYRPGDFVMGERSRIASFNRVVGYGGKLRLGAQSFVALNCLIDVTGDVEVGERSAIGPRSMLYSHGVTGLVYNVRYPTRIGPIRIGADCWLGMGCTVHPQVTIGERVLILPGMVIRRNIPPEMSVIPRPDEYELVPTGRMVLGVSESVQQAKLDELFCEFASRQSGSRLDQSNLAAWRLGLRNGKLIVLLRDASPIVETRPPSTDVLWTLTERAGKANATVTFCFQRLTIYGQRTPFAEVVANKLCQDFGVHFVFDAPRSAGHQELGPSSAQGPA